MNIISIQRYSSPVGDLLVGAFDNKLCLCDWTDRKMRKTIDRRLCRRLKASYSEQDHVILSRAKAQLDEYFQKKRKVFDLPLLLAGTSFQKSVWEALLKIPYSATSSYTLVAESLGKRKAVRAVASANGANAISIIIPCHRVIGSNGQLAGYAGGLAAKRSLLTLEKQIPRPSSMKGVEE